MSKQRLQKLIAQAGLASRRQAEEWIREGLVSVNGRLAKLGDQADLSEDAIKVKGKLLRPVTAKVHYAFNKPKGVISTLGTDPEGRTTLAPYLEKIKTRIFPVGKLEYNSEGMLLLTNDMELSKQIQSSTEILRTYRIKVKGHPDAKKLEGLQKGTKEEGKLIKPYSVKLHQHLKSKTFIDITFKGMKALNFKLLFERNHFLIERIVCVGIGHLSLEGIETGKLKALKPTQFEALVKQTYLGEKRVAASGKGSPKKASPPARIISKKSRADI